ncbi:hypothetical protein B0I32_10135 [Nonomuraea fuscirosea]|uniref:Uncharacterized protein n=1 Tax=Nonomuraea fuscirosea TaxID=1291556 RepID=A0A2T0NAB2_9ACTN|nr:hypothetical protein [Nonomuraea fuscirosea]PRX69951.1 hypothetical protein B0I32_10135 [Nonomuraea fuscirosea]
MAPPPHEEASPRKSSKAVPLAVLGVLSLTLVGIWAISESDDDEVTADCVMLVEDDFSTTTTTTPTPTPALTATESPTASPTESPTGAPTPTATTSAPPSGSYQVVDDDYCDDDSHRYYGGGHSRGAYVWYYGGTRIGNRVHRGTTFRPSDVNISSRTGKSIQRGGFGSRTSSGS